MNTELRKKLGAIVVACENIGNKFVEVAVNSMANILDKFGFDGSEFSVAHSNLDSESSEIGKMKNQISFLGSNILHESVIEFKKNPRRKIHIIVIDKYEGMSNQLWFFKFFNKLELGMTCYKQGVLVFRT